MLKTALTSKTFLVFSCQFALDLITAWVSSSESLGIIFFTAASILCIGPKLDRASGEYASRVRKAVHIQVHSITHSLPVVSLSQSKDSFIFYIKSNQDKIKCVRDVPSSMLWKSMSGWVGSNCTSGRAAWCHCEISSRQARYCSTDCRVESTYSRLRSIVDAVLAITGKSIIDLKIT